MAYKYERSTNASRRAKRPAPKFLHVSKSFETAVDSKGQKLTRITTSTRCRVNTLEGRKARNRERAMAIKDGLVPGYPKVSTEDGGDPGDEAKVSS